MAFLYDINTHLNSEMYLYYSISSVEIVKEAKKSGVKYINNVGFDVLTSKRAVIQAEKNKHVYAIVGIHPQYAHLFNDSSLDEIKSLANFDKTVAIGAIGFDYRKGQEFKEEQKHMLIEQIKIAKSKNLPIMFHATDIEGSFDAYQDLYDVIVAQKIKSGTIHSYQGNAEWATKFVKLGLHLSINGIVTFDKRLQEIVKNTKLSHIMVETDSPYSAPKPYEKKINYPKNLPLIIKKIADLHNVSNISVDNITSDNAINMFLPGTN